MQVYKRTSDTAKVEADIKKLIRVKPLPFEKHIGARLFNILLKQTPKEDQKRYIEHGIPYRHDLKDGHVDYILKVKG